MITFYQLEMLLYILCINRVPYIHIEFLYKYEVLYKTIDLTFLDLKTIIHASVVKYFLTLDIRYSLCDTWLHSPSICLLKLRCSSKINPRYLYEHTLSSISLFRDKLISLV